MKIQGRIIQGIGGLYHISALGKIYFARPKGIFRKKGVEPVVGDFVEIDVISHELMEAVITQIYPRINQLLRPKVSNVNQSILVFSCSLPAINLDLLDRLTIVSHQQGLTNIVIVLNKIDEAINLDRLESVACSYKAIGYNVLYTSAVTGAGVGELVDILANKTSVFCGASGVGKSSLINRLLPSANMDVGVLSQKGNRGKHTTRFSKLIELYPDSFIVDSPGFSSITFDFTKNSLDQYFKEFVPFLDICRFANCSHIKEIDCAIKDNVGVAISQERYLRYKKIYEECSS